MVTVAAVDLGASSGRVVVGHVGPDHLTLDEVARFDNVPVPLPDGLHWDLLGLHRHALAGLWTAVSQSSDGLESVAVDSWAVDYGLLSGNHLLGSPFHYRDERTTRGVKKTHRKVPFEHLYARNGLQFLPFNTLYQLEAEDLLDVADSALLVPDLVGFWLTGRRATERTNASTTGLLDPRTREWDEDLMKQLGLPTGLFAPLADPGDELGTVSAGVGAAIGQTGLVVRHVGSHDTASAVVGTPMTTDDAAYISCGTWGLVGVELDAPVTTAGSQAANLTNEGGVDGRTRFLTNVMGTWLLSETIRTWERQGHTADLAALLAAAADVPAQRVVVFDVDDPSFSAPGDMPSRIASWCARHDKRIPASHAELVRSIVESIADGFARALERVEEHGGKRISTVHVVGGGSRNGLLCQATADRSGRTVLAGPVEATALGNVLVQARAAGAVSGTLEDLRALVARTHDLVPYLPTKDSR